MDLVCAKCGAAVHPVSRICLLGHHFVQVAEEVERIKCPLQSTNGCLWTGYLGQVASHGQQCHFDNFSTLRKRHFLLSLWFESKISYYHILSDIYGKLFKTVIEINSETGFVIWRVLCMGSNEEADDYYFEVCLKNLNDGGEIYRTASCQATNGGSIAKGRMYVVTDLSIVRQFCKNGRLFCSVSICKEDDDVPFEDSWCVNNVSATSPRPCVCYKSSELPSVKHFMVPVIKSLV